MRSATQWLIASVVLVALSTGCNGSVRRVETERKVVALTFDDGPNPPFTEGLLAVLAEKKVPATFFLIGMQIEAHPDATRKILDAGHEVGGHSYDWSSLVFKSRTHVAAKLDRMDHAFAGIGVTNLVLFRPPNGLLSPGQGKLLEDRGLTTISADVVVGDWKTTDSGKIRDAVLRKVRPGSIIALHDGGGDRTATIAAVPQIIDALRKQGFSFMKVGDLLNL